MNMILVHAYFMGHSTKLCTSNYHWWWPISNKYFESVFHCNVCLSLVLYIYGRDINNNSEWLIDCVMLSVLKSVILLDASDWLKNVFCVWHFLHVLYVKNVSHRGAFRLNKAEFRHVIFRSQNWKYLSIWT